MEMKFQAILFQSFLLTINSFFRYAVVTNCNVNIHMIVSVRITSWWLPDAGWLG